VAKVIEGTERQGAEGCEVCMVGTALFPWGRDSEEGLCPLLRIFFGNSAYQMLQFCAYSYVALI